MGCGVVQTKSDNANRSARPCPSATPSGQDILIYTTQLDINAHVSINAGSDSNLTWCGQVPWPDIQIEYALT